MQWADYIITAVRYDPKRTHISEVEVRPDNGSTIGVASVWARSTVVSEIDKGRSFVTAFSRNGQWTRGADVHVVTIGYDRYLRTDRNQRRADNLGELPELPATVAQGGHGERHAS